MTGLTGQVPEGHSNMAELSNKGTQETAYLPPSAPPMNHGHTTAAWVTTIMVMIGVAAAAVGVLTATVWLFWVGIGIALGGIVVGKVLQILGFGQPDPNLPADQRNAV